VQLVPTRRDFARPADWKPAPRASAHYELFASSSFSSSSSIQHIFDYEDDDEKEEDSVAAWRSSAVTKMLQKILRKVLTCFGGPD